MAIWIEIWKFCLIASVAAFALMAVVVTIGGALDIRRLLRRLDERDPAEED